jgi:hypothetical protein
VRVLLDHNLPHKLRTGLGKHEIVTASFMKWGELKNGELLRAAEVNGIDEIPFFRRGSRRSSYSLL